MKQNLTTIVAAVILAGASAPLLHARSGGPPLGKVNCTGQVCTSGPACGTCLDCHGSFPLNSGDGSFAITGFPATYTPGQTYDLTVSLSDAGQSRWGFEVAVMTATRCNAGVLDKTAGDSSTQVRTTSDLVRFLEQTAAGTFAGVTTGATWAAKWTAPAPPAAIEPVYLYGCGNAADNTDGTDSDYIYCLTAPLESVPEAAPVEICTNGVDDDGDTLADCLDPDCAADPNCVPPDEITTLRVSREVQGGVPGSRLAFSWDPASGTGAAQVNLYRGDLDLVYSHQPMVNGCGQPRTSPLMVDSAQVGGSPVHAYYLCVPVTAGGVEGPYGFASSGSPIPPATSPCP